MADQTPNAISAHIDRFENDKAVIVFADGQKLVMPRTTLPKDAAEGHSVSVRVLLDKDTALEEKTAKQLLEEILNSPSEQ